MCEDEDGPEEEEVEETDRPIHISGGVTTTIFRLLGLGDTPSSEDYTARA